MIFQITIYSLLIQKEKLPGCSTVRFDLRFRVIVILNKISKSDISKILHTYYISINVILRGFVKKTIHLDLKSLRLLYLSSKTKTFRNTFFINYINCCALRYIKVQRVYHKLIHSNPTILYSSKNSISQQKKSCA